MTSTIENQIEKILSGDLLSILDAKYGFPPYTSDQITGAVDFSREQLLKYVTQNGFPSGSYIKGANSSDGIHLVTENKYWLVYYQERNCKSLKFECENRDDVKEVLMDLMVYLSGLVGPIQFTETFRREIAVF